MTNHKAAREIIKLLKRMNTSLSELIAENEEEINKFPERELTAAENDAMVEQLRQMRQLAVMLESKS